MENSMPSKISIILIVLVGHFSLNLCAKETKILRLGFDPWCPHTCAGTDEGVGFEITRMAFQLQGFQIESKIESWSKSIELARKGELDGIVGALVTDAPDFIFPISEIGFQQSCIYALFNSNQKQISQLTELKGMKLGLVKGYAYGESIDHIVANPTKDGPMLDFISGVETTQRLLQKLQKNRIDLFAEDKSVVQYYLSSHPEVKIKEIYCLRPEKIFVAFSPKNKERSEMLSNLFNSGYGQLKKTDQIDRIFKKYGLTKHSP